MPGSLQSILVAFAGIFWSTIYCKVNYWRKDLSLFCCSGNNVSPWTQDVNWTYKRRSKDVQDVFWTSYVLSVYTLCRGGYSPIAEQCLIRVDIKIQKRSQHVNPSCPFYQLNAYFKSIVHWSIIIISALKKFSKQFLRISHLTPVYPEWHMQLSAMSQVPLKQLPLPHVAVINRKQIKRWIFSGFPGYRKIYRFNKV